MPTATGTEPGSLHLDFIAREEAVQRLAAHRATRDAYLIAIPPALLAAAARNLAPIRECAYYVDSSGTGELMTATGARAGEAVAVVAKLLPPTLLTVAVVPKTVAAVAVAAALGLPDVDDARDLRVLTTGAGSAPMVWPRVLVDALERVDPQTAARIRASRVEPAQGPRGDRTRRGSRGSKGRR